jgi:hypothetical protein
MVDAIKSRIPGYLSKANLFYQWAIMFNLSYIIKRIFLIQIWNNI